MVEVWLPYGKTEVCLRVPTRNFLGSVEPKEKPSLSDVKGEVERALKEPIGSQRLCEAAKAGDKAVIVLDGDTSMTVGRALVPPILDELNGAGVRDEDITLILGWGVNGGFAGDASAFLGENLARRVKVVSHDLKASDFVYVGATKGGTKVYLNRIFAEADLKILAGVINPHPFMGYVGGRSGVLPGVASEETVKANHAMLLHSNAGAGVLEGNPVHEDAVEAARIAKVDFTLNVVVNVKGEVVKAFAGDLEKAFYEGVRLFNEMYRVAVDRRADVVVVSAGGYPADINLARAWVSVDNVSEIAKRGGVVVLVAECTEGYGNQAFYKWMVKFKDLKAVEREIKRNFVWGGHSAYQLMRALQKNQIILVSILPDYYAVNVFRLKTARTVNEALNQAFRTVGENAKVWAVPYGNYTLPEVGTVGQSEQQP
ncbi:MAG: nickel-dependent lactate racemase [Candidatus Bathyarchaeia archaeon]